MYPTPFNSMSKSTSDQRTSVSVERSTLNRLKAAKPYDSMSYDEFFQHVLDRVEERGLE